MRSEVLLKPASSGLGLIARVSQLGVSTALVASLVAVQNDRINDSERSLSGKCYAFDGSR